jgi:hypothetical protein
MTYRHSVCVAGALFLSCICLRSETVYSNFGVPGPDGSGGGYLLGPAGHFPFGGFFGIAVPFVPTADYTVDTIRIPITAYTGLPQNQITVELRDGETEPEAVLERYSVAASGFSVMNLRSSLHPAVGAGKQYWIVVTTEGGGTWGWGGLVHPPGTVFVRNTQYREWSRFSAPSYIPGLDVSGTPVTAGPPAHFGNGGSMPHVVAGGGWQTTFVLVNTGVTSSSVQLTFWNDSGSPLSMPLVFPEPRGSATAASIAETIPAGGSVRITAPDTEALRQGWGILSTTGDVRALAILRSNPSGQELGLPVETRNANSYLLAFEDAGETRTGIALANLSAIPVNIRVMIRDESGALLESTTVSLLARGHTSFDLTGRYAVTKDKRGTIQFDTPEFGRISVFGLRTAPAGSGGSLSFTNIPVLAR